MTLPFATGVGGRTDDVVGVEVTIDGTLVLADRLSLVEFPVSLGIRENIPDEEIRDRVWDQVRRDLAAQQVLDIYGTPQPTVAAMLEVLSRPERTIEGRWFRKQAGEKVVRFALCRKGQEHVLAVRDGDLLVVQLISARVELADMVTAVLGTAQPADVEPLTGPADELAGCTSAAQISHHGVGAASARVYAEIIGDPIGWVEITATQRHSGGTSTQADVAAGVIDSVHGRLVSLPRRVGGQLYGSFLPGTNANLQRALDGLLELLPAGRWSDAADAFGNGDAAG